MTEWPEIQCQRGHVRGEHRTRRVTVDLGRPHGYGDLPAVPERLARRFDMLVWDPDLYPVDSVPAYCPAHDAVSATIVSEGIWEPAETILTLMVCESGAEGCVVDVGAQIGWFSVLAASCGRCVVAVEADPDNASVLRANLDAHHDGSTCMTVLEERIGADSGHLRWSERIRLAKIDVEGAEAAAVEWLWPVIAAGALEHLAIEMSPCFAPGYPELAERLASAGMVAYRLPEKARPPTRLEDPERDLERLSDPAAHVATIRQENLWWRHEGASW